MTTTSDALGTPFAEATSSGKEAAEYARLTARALKIESRQLGRRLATMLALIVIVGLTVAGAWIASSAALGYWFYDSGTSAVVAILSVAAVNLVFGLLLTLAALRIGKDIGLPVTQSLLARLTEVIPHG